MKRIAAAALVSTVVAVAVAAAALAAGAGVTNGGFESGSLAPWSTIDAGGGGWNTDTGSGRGNLSCARADHFGGPRSGAYDALYDQGNPTSGVLYQDVVVPTGATTLTFSLMWENDLALWHITQGAAYSTSVPNQWLSVDVLKAGADPKTFAASDIIATPVRFTSGASDTQSPWQTFAVHLGSYAGQTVRLRFAAGDSLYCLPFAVDDVAFVPNAVIQDDRVAYCSVAGDTWPDGSAIPPGTFLNLEPGQPAIETEYAGAVPANYVAGVGLTCDPPPAGDTQQGYAGDAQHVAGGIYPYYAPPSP